MVLKGAARYPQKHKHRPFPPCTIPVNEGVAKGPEKKGTTKITNVHDEGLSPSVMQALATESRRHRGKAFFSLFRVSVPPWQFSFTAKSTKKSSSFPLCSLCLCGSRLFCFLRQPLEAGMAENAEGWQGRQKRLFRQLADNWTVSDEVKKKKPLSAVHSQPVEGGVCTLLMPGQESHDPQYG